MALTGIQIYKLLPKTNCGECGVPTCLAFAMSLAAGKAELAACPYVTEEAKTELLLYMDSSCNLWRRHSTLDYLSPGGYEQLCSRQKTTFA